MLTEQLLRRLVPQQSGQSLNGQCSALRCRHFLSNFDAEDEGLASDGRVRDIHGFD